MLSVRAYCCPTQPVAAARSKNSPARANCSTFGSFLIIEVPSDETREQERTQWVAYVEEVVNHAKMA
jgi:hypothetical protein